MTPTNPAAIYIFENDFFSSQEDSYSPPPSLCLWEPSFADCVLHSHETDFGMDDIMGSISCDAPAPLCSDPLSLDFISSRFMDDVSPTEDTMSLSHFESSAPSSPCSEESCLASADSLTSVSSTKTASYFSVDLDFPWDAHVKDSDRRNRIKRWKEKKLQILSGESRPIRHVIRKRVADSRMRIGGRFVSKAAEETLQSDSLLGLKTLNT